MCVDSVVLSTWVVSAKRFRPAMLAVPTVYDTCIGSGMCKTWWLIVSVISVSAEDRDVWMSGGPAERKL